jgi:hypothetical protein
VRRQGEMRRTLGEWEKLWREHWDINDYADLDSVFADTQDFKDVICEVEIIIDTREGSIVKTYPYIGNLGQLMLHKHIGT